MSLTLIALLVGQLQAATTGSLQYNAYSGDSGVNVVTPAFDFSTDLNDRTKLNVLYGLDAVSAASFNHAQSKTHRNDPDRQKGKCLDCHVQTDALTGATRTYIETRHGLEVGVKVQHGEQNFGGAYKMSRENDYNSDGANLSWQLEAFDRNATFALDLQYLRDEISAVTRSFKDYLYSGGLDASYTQILGPGTLAQIGWSYAQADGYQQNPYAYVETVTWRTHWLTDPIAPRVPRADQPRFKSRHVASLTLKQALPWDSAIQSDYRYYRDDWEVQSHSLDFTLSKELWGILIEPNLRYEWQPQGAYFFKNFYDGTETYISRDLKLAPHSTRLIGLTLRGKMAEHWGGELNYSYYVREDALDYRLYYADRPENAQIIQFAITYE